MRDDIFPFDVVWYDLNGKIKEPEESCVGSSHEARCASQSKPKIFFIKSAEGLKYAQDAKP